MGWWINPSGYFAAAEGVQANRPIQGGDGVVANFGPQGVTTWGASLRYTFDIPWKLTFIGEYASSQYKPNNGSSYQASGTAARFALEALLANEALKLGLNYMSVEPKFDPFLAAYPQPTGVCYGYWRLPSLSYAPYYYSLHDVDTYTHNRQGWKFYFDYKFQSGDGRFYGNYQDLEQKEASVADVSSFAAGVNYNPSVTGPGFSPGWMESFFPALLMNPTYGNTSTNFLAIESPKGKVTNFMLGVDYKFPNTKLGIELGYKDWRFRRDSILGNNIVTGFGTIANPNYVDMNLTQGHIGLSYPINDRFTLYGGYDFATIRGAYMSKNTNMDTKQTVPYLGFGYNISENTTWNLNLKAYNVNDGITTDPDSGYTNGGFEWNGSQISTELKVSF